MRERLRRGVRRIFRGSLSWASLLAIPIGIAVGLKGSMTLRTLLVLGRTLAYFLVDPIMLILDLRLPMIPLKPTRAEAERMRPLWARRAILDRGAAKQRVDSDRYRAPCCHLEAQGNE